jgi:hypothetical protein
MDSIESITKTSRKKTDAYKQLIPTVVVQLGQLL